MCCAVIQRYLAPVEQIDRWAKRRRFLFGFGGVVHDCLMIRLTVQIQRALHKAGEENDQQQSGNGHALIKSPGVTPLRSVSSTFCNIASNKREFKQFPLLYYKSRNKINVTPCQIRHMIAPWSVICSDRILTLLAISAVECLVKFCHKSQKKSQGV